MLEPDVRSSRFVVVRDILNATPLRAATFTRTTPPLHKMPNATPIGLLPTGTINRKNGVSNSGWLRGYLCCGERCSLMFMKDCSSQGKEVVRANYVRFSVGPDMRQVEDFEREFAGVSWEGKGDGEIEWQVGSLLPVDQLQSSR